MGCLLFFTALRNKDARYTLPMLPAAMVIATYWISYCRARIQALLRAALIVYSAGAFLIISFGLSYLPPEVTLSFKPVELVALAQRGYIIGPPSREQWHQEAIIKRLAASSTPRTLYSAGNDSIWFNRWGSAYYAKLYHIDQVASYDRAQYAIVRSPTIMTDMAFEQIGHYALPDGSSMNLYERKLAAP